ncbi:MAG TPA: hypothetical protein P5555_13320 [Candidatus Paceibacterota bacterium]|nr:hypothetical protein [Verrucomicrobiota bacterium]HRZ46164.1 hypothetical protein [Candidatus Paceibacterota bacterium]
MKRIRKWHGRWLLIAAVLGLSVGGSGQWADRRQQSFPPAIALPNGPSPGDAGLLGSMGWAGSGRANRAEPDAGLWPEAGADGRYRVIDASRYDRQLQREHELVLCQGHRVLWRFGEQLREEALDSIRWSAAGGVVGRAVGTAVKTARQAVRHGHSATKSGQCLLTAGTDFPNAGGVIRSFVQESDQVYYRVFSGDRTIGSFLTAVPPRSSAWAQEALSLPPGNTAEYIQEVLVPAGARLQRSRALPVRGWGRSRGGAEQFQLLEHIPVQNFGPGRPLP